MAAPAVVAAGEAAGVGLGGSVGGEYSRPPRLKQDQKIAAFGSSYNGRMYTL